ncbi:MAG: hypothetical protein JWM44_3012 [Bacilli bacterium]|nr:hypothetical protein [Bacilli bacterium]
MDKVVNKLNKKKSGLFFMDYIIFFILIVLVIYIIYVFIAPSNSTPTENKDDYYNTY